MLFKPSGLTMTVTPPVSRLRFFNEFSRLGVGHILSITIAICSGFTISLVKFSTIVFTATCGVVLGIVVVFLFSCVRICRVILSRSRFTQGLTGELISHERKDKWKL